MILKVRQLMSKSDVIRHNNIQIRKYRQETTNNIICSLKPEIVKIIQDAVNHNIKELKTSNIDLLNCAELIFKQFKIKVTSCS